MRRSMLLPEVPSAGHKLGFDAKRDQVRELMVRRREKIIDSTIYKVRFSIYTCSGLLSGGLQLTEADNHCCRCPALQLSTGGLHMVEHCSPSHPKPAWFGCATSSHTHSSRDNAISHLFSTSNGLDMHKGHP